MTEELLKYFNNDDLAAKVWLDKYALLNEKTPADMHRRLAKEFARVELSNKIDITFYKQEYLSKYGQSRKVASEEYIFGLFDKFKYVIPQGSIMSQLGSGSIGSLSNCFVVGQPEDSYGGIFQKDEEIAQLEKRRGGVGTDLSTLRPVGTPTSNAAKTSTGAVSFMHRFSNTTREVAQNGRRGALMISMDVNHPDIMEFIKIKRDLTQVTGANISIKLNNKFMKAVENDEDYILRFPCDVNIDNTYWAVSSEEPEYNNKFEGFKYNESYDVYDGDTDKTVHIKRIKAKEYWDEIIKSAHSVAEPGLMFWDKMVNYSPDGVYPQFRQVTTNPCSEIGMQAYDACRLIAVNLYNFVKDPYTDKAAFDFKKFYEINYEAMCLSDNLITLEVEHIDRIIQKIEKDPESILLKIRELELWKKIRATALSSRRTGLGFTALGDTLAALNLKYDSQEALSIINEIMYVKMRSELDCTIDLGLKFGTFEGWKGQNEFFGNPDNELVGKNEFYDFIAKTYPEQAKKLFLFGRRNLSWSTVAPTGTVSLLTQTTSGIEPLFQPFYTRRKKVNPGENVKIDFVDNNGDSWQEFAILHPKFRDWMNKTYDYNEVVFNQSSKENLQIAFKQSPWYNSTANDINWEKRVDIQSTIQKYITHSISSTINLPEDVSEKEVSNIYLQSFNKGVKGITVYRDGSRSGVLISNKSKDKTKFEYKDAVKRPKELEAKAHITKIGGVDHSVIIGFLDGKPYEIFIDTEFNLKGKGTLRKKSKGNYTFINENEENTVTDFMLDEQVAVTRLASGMLRHGADIKFIVEQLNKTPGGLFSFTKGLARVLKKYIPDGVKSTVICNECGSDNVIFEEGCNKCLDCGNSKCG